MYMAIPKYSMNYFVIASLTVPIVAFADTPVSTWDDGSRSYIQSDRPQVLNIYPVRADGRRDYTLSSVRVEGGNAYQVRLDGRRYWNTPLYTIVPSNASSENKTSFSSKDYYSSPLREATK